MSDIYWFSADSRGRVIAKTEIKPNGQVIRYPFTIPDDINSGHGHQIYNTLEDFIRNHPDEANWERKANHPDSINRKWKGPG